MFVMGSNADNYTGQATLFEASSQIWQTWPHLQAWTSPDAGSGRFGLLMHVQWCSSS